jgi:hypothetical protein
MVNSHGLIRALTLGNSMITIFMVKVFMNGLMEESSTEIGETIKWRDMVALHGQMEENMSEHILMI